MEFKMDSNSYFQSNPLSFSLPPLLYQDDALASPASYEDAAFPVTTPIVDPLFTLFQDTYQPFLDSDTKDTQRIKLEIPMQTLAPEELLSYPSPSSSEHDCPVSPLSPPSHQQKRLSRAAARRRRSSYGQSSDSLDATSSGRMSHNLVERKYRDGLNAELNKLRLMLPHIGAIKHATKAQILASAANYIEQLENKCEQLQHEKEKRQYGEVRSKKSRRSG